MHGKNWVVYFVVANVQKWKSQFFLNSKFSVETGLNKDECVFIVCHYFIELWTHSFFTSFT